MAKITTPNYDIANLNTLKRPLIVMTFDGLPYSFSSGDVYSTLRYGDPGINYGDGYIYGGLRKLGKDKIKDWIDIKSGQTTISQRIEPWDGKSSVQTMNITLIDVNKEVTKLISPGVGGLTEILNKRVTIKFGYQTVSFPEDYVTIFYGYVNNISAKEGKITFEFTDPSSKRKQEIFNESTATLVGAISPTDTTITLSSTSNRYIPVLDGLNVSDPTLTYGINIGDEIITYLPSNVSGNTITSVVRGARNTTASSHSIGDQVKYYLGIEDDPISISLKMMLSGWNGPWIEQLPCRGIINTDDGFTLNDSITGSQDVNFERDYGLVADDYVILSGFTIPTNNGTFRIESFQKEGRTIVVREKGVLLQENPGTPGVIAFRSKYDTYPISAGLSLSPIDVYVDRHEYFKDTFVQQTFLFDIVGREKNAKEFIEKQLMQPISGYSLTQNSKISMGMTHPPLADDLTKFIDHTNVVDPKAIEVNRGLNNRMFYNAIFFEYAYDVIKDEYKKSLRVIDADSIKRMNQVSTLNIQIKGLPDSVESETFLRQRAQRILLRYRYGAETISVSTLFGTGHLIDAGDIIVLSDRQPNPMLNISNTSTGERGVVNRIMETLDRSIGITSGQTKVKLLSNNGFEFSDRYGVIAPSSLVGTIIDNKSFIIIDSFGAKFPGREWLKWQKYQGLKIKIHDSNYTRVGVSTFSLDKSNPYQINLDTALSFVPQVGDIVEFDDYDETSSSSQSAIKNRYVSLDRVSTILSGSSSTVFTLDSGLGALYSPGLACYVQSPDGTRLSSNLKTISIIGDIVTVGALVPGGDSDLGFTPQPGDYFKLGGFRDLGNSYRYL